METEASRQLVLDYYEALGDPARLAQVLADGDTVVVLQHMSCVATNGRDYSNEYVWVFKCADGRIVRMEEHLDTACFQQVVLNP